MNPTRDPLKILIATTNPGKLVELTELLEPFEIQPVGINTFPDIDEIAETGCIFSENAVLKASGYARQTGMLTLADDSGLEVAALDGRPGVHSARYGGEHADFDEKMYRLLTEMNESGKQDRRARFVCAVAIAAADGKILFSSEGVCQGSIATLPRGNSGFGYDPLFVPDGYEKTFGELSIDIKQKISHRSRAFAQIIPFLGDYISILT